MIFLKKYRFLPAVVLLVTAFTSCDDDFNTIGGELIGGELPGLPQYEAGVVAYNKRLNPVQTNNLPSHLLGVYNEPVYGQQIANVLTKVSLARNNPNFGNEPRLDSVVLTLPYFSSREENDEEENAVYSLDSVYGDAPFKLSVNRSGFFLNDFDPEENFANRQRYYSDQGELFENNLVGSPLYVNEAFKPSPREVVYFEEDDDSETNEIDTVRVAPRLRVNLPVQYFQENIIDKQGDPELFNNNSFQNFFRGLYFKAEPINDQGSMLLLNFDSSNTDAGITLYYTSFPEDADDDEGIPGTFELNFASANTVNTFSQEFPASIEQNIEASNDFPGAENLYLKGGEGSMAVIELFEDEEEIQAIRDNNWLINEANLTFYVNQEMVPGGETEPTRVYLYNLDNNDILIDYQADPTAVAENPALAVITHLQPLERGEDGKGIHYKLRITEHVRRILTEDISNVRLGLVVTQNVKIINFAALKEPIDLEDGENITRVPSASVITPEGTVLHGNLSPNTEKRLKFNIFYTETNN